MKTQINLLIPLFFLFISGSVPAQSNNKNVDTTDFKVEGVCNMCKARIENASLIKGVKFSEWNKDSKLLTVIYRVDKVSQDEIEKAVAEAGHDTEKVKADKKTYDKLPNCCAYRDGIESH